MKKSKSKLKLFNVIMIFATVALAVMTFVSMSFKFVITNGEVLGFGGSKEMALGDWMDLVSEATIEQFDVWKTARVFMIVLLVLVAILAVATLLKFILKGNKILDLGVQILAILTLVCAIVFIVLMYVGANNLNADIGVASSGYTVSAGALCMAIFGGCGAITGFLAVKK